jgi:membrane protein
VRVHTAADRALFFWHDVRNFARRVFEGAIESNVPFLASGLAFDALLAAIPFILLLLSVVASVLNASAGRAQVEIHDYLLRLLPEGADRGAIAPVLRLIEGLVRERGTLRLVGIPLFVWFSTRLYSSLRACLCEVFDVEETRTWVRGKLVDAALVVVTTLLFVLNTGISEGVTVMARASVRFGFVEFFGAQVLAFAVVLALFVLLFRVAPARPVRWDTAFVAALITSVGFEVAKQVLSIYFENMMRPDQIVRNATVGALLLLVFWTYYITFVFLMGAQIAQVYDLRRRQTQQRILLHD